MKKLGSKVKQMNLVSIAKAASLVVAMKSVDSALNKTRLWREAMNHFEAALLVTPDDRFITRMCAQALMEEGKRLASSFEVEKMASVMLRACQLFKRNHDCETIVQFVKMLTGIVRQHFREYFDTVNAVWYDPSYYMGQVLLFFFYNKKILVSKSMEIGCQCWK